MESIFGHNSGNIAVIIGFVVLYLVIKPIYNSLSQKTKSGKTKLTVESVVLETPFFVYKEKTIDSDILAELLPGETFYLDPNFSHSSFHKIILKTGVIGYIQNRCKFKRKD